MKTAIFILLILSLFTMAGNCNFDGKGGIFCYEQNDLEGRWRRDADVNNPSQIRIDGSGFVVEADRPFEYLVGRQGKVDCNGNIHYELKGEFVNEDRILLEGLYWNKI